MKNLKTILATVTALLLLSSNAFAQKGQSGNCVEEGTIIIDAFYGYPYVAGAVLKSAFTNRIGEVRNTNHFGVKAEYMVSEKIGLGIEYTYADASLTYTDSTLREYEAGIKKSRFLGKLNFHFATTESIDPYFTVGAGVKNTTIYNNGSRTNSISINVVPVAVRIGVGLHYFFTDVVGVNAEVGIGGPVMQAGVSFKF